MNRVIYERGEDEIVEKKSRFIGEVVPVASEEEVQAYLESVRKKHYNANHHCFAYVLGEKNQTERASDDGEPSGTAGRPILHVLQAEEIRNALLVVTRYFGGTLLGTGGLTRAYTAAAKAAVDAAKVVEKKPGVLFRIRMDYTSLGKIQYIIGQMELMTQDTAYTEDVELAVAAPAEAAETFRKKVTEVTGATAVFLEEREITYGVLDEQVLVWDDGKERV